jgi:hypothetical protein
LRLCSRYWWCDMLDTILFAQVVGDVWDRVTGAAGIITLLGVVGLLALTAYLGKSFPTKDEWRALKESINERLDDAEVDIEKRFAQSGREASERMDRLERALDRECEARKAADMERDALMRNAIDVANVARGEAQNVNIRLDESERDRSGLHERFGSLKRQVVQLESQFTDQRVEQAKMVGDFNLKLEQMESRITRSVNSTINESMSKLTSLIEKGHRNG